MAGKRTYIVDDFIIKLRGHLAFQTSPWPQRIDDLEAVLRTLFVSDNERAIETFDEVRGVIERKHCELGIFIFERKRDRLPNRGKECRSGYLLRAVSNQANEKGPSHPATAGQHSARDGRGQFAERGATVRPCFALQRPDLCGARGEIPLGLLGQACRAISSRLMAALK